MGERAKKRLGTLMDACDTEDAPSATFTYDEWL